METRNFRALLEARWERGCFVCVGLDSEREKIPNAAHRFIHPTIAFNCAVVEATHDLVCAYKPNLAFYAARGSVGINDLRKTIADIHAIAPDVPVILDAKVGDIGNTNAGYVQFVFEFLNADAITVHPYLGAEALGPFLAMADKGVIVLCHTSNPGAGEFQIAHVRLDNLDHTAFEQHIGHKTPKRTVPLYQYLAFRVASAWNTRGNCALVVGATYPDELRAVREIAPDLPILIPGVGAQGGDVEQVVTAGQDRRGRGFIVNSSRGIIFASSGEDFAPAARHATERLHETIARYRRADGGSHG